MKKQFPIFTLLLLSLILSCSPATQKEAGGVNLLEPELTNWLVGSWEFTQSQIPTFETWKKENDSTLSGYSYAVRNGDTIVTERLLWQIREGESYYIPTVDGQNDNEAILFKLSSSLANQWIFENPTHDFPQKITYIKIDENQLTAEISAQTDSSERKITFPMRRVVK
ncbi:DUF6265 family protein [Fulvivirgaceae bacterium LMO-SS25]